MGSKPVKFTEEQEQKIVALHMSGQPISVSEIARRFGCSFTPIRRVLRKHDIPIRSCKRSTMYLSEDYREGYTNGWRAALSAMRPVRLSAAWQRVHGHWKRNLVEWQEPGHDDVPPPAFLVKG